MAYFFADTWDCYSAGADAVAGYWDAGTAAVTFAAGRFSGSRSISTSGGFSATTAMFQKSSSSNDAIHHISVAIQQTSAITGTNNFWWLTLLDGATAQCSVVFRSDGAILLTAGASNGTTLATYTGALTAANTWYQFEIEVNVSNTAGYMNVRKLGNTSNDFASATNLDTSQTANNYANRLTLGVGNAAATSQFIDDLIWRSDASSVPWIGDVRGWARNPVSDASVQWTRSGTGSLIQSIAGSGATNTIGSVGSSYAQLYTCLYPGSLASFMIATYGAATGNIKGAVWADNSGVPGAVLASCPSQAMVVGNNVFTLSPSLSVTPGQRIWIAACADTPGGSWNTNATSNATSASGIVGFASFPQANPSLSIPSRNVGSNIVYNNPTGNYQMVQEAQQDAATSYVYSSNVNDSDLYGIGAISSTPASVVAVVTRAYVQKSDAGTRNVAVQLRSGGTTVQGTSTALNTTFGWLSRTDLVDPATGLAWTAVGVANCNIGVVVTA